MPHAAVTTYNQRAVVGGRHIGTGRAVAKVERRKQVARLMRRGVVSVKEIAQRLGVTSRQIRKDIRFLEQQWIEESSKDFQAFKALMFQKLQDREAELHAWWERTQLDSETIRKTIGLDGGESTESTTTERTGQAGDPRYFGHLKDLFDQQIALLKLFEPAEGRNETNVITQVNIAAFDDQRIVELKQALEKQAGLQPKQEIVIEQLPHQQPPENHTRTDAEQPRTAEQ